MNLTKKISANYLEQHSDDMAKLATNFIDIVSDCDGADGYMPKNLIQDRFPLVSYLLDTPMARAMRYRSIEPQNFARSSEEGIEWEMKVPNTIWTLEPSNTSTECCWVMPDFAKCVGSVPLFLLCLKDCDDILSNLIYDRLRMNERTALDGISRSGESLETVNERIRQMWMAFYTAKTAIVGTSTTSDNVVKPFHGLLEVMENTAVASINGSNILAGFDSLGCRLAVLGGNDWVIAVNPLIYRSIDKAIVAGQNGELPAGWTRVNGVLRFMGIGFIQDSLVPVDLTAGTGEAWVLDGNSVGLFLARDINDAYRRDNFTETAKADGCAEECVFYYNFGAVANNNAQRLAVIDDIPVDAACTNAIGDLGGLINPNTLIPA